MDLLGFNQKTLTFVYHVPFFVKSKQIWSAHPATGRYIDALAGYFSEVIIVAPRKTSQDKITYRLEAANIRVLELPPYRNIGQFWLKAHHYFIKLFRAASDWDLLHIRLPTHLGFPAYLAARCYRKPVFLVVVGEGLAYSRFYQYSPVKQSATNADAHLQDFFMRKMVHRCLTFTNGEDLLHKYKEFSKNIYLMRSSTINETDIASPDKDTCKEAPYRILTVATIAPRKGTSLIPDVIQILRKRGIDARWLYIGKADGNDGEQELRRTLKKAASNEVSSLLKFSGWLSWDDLQAYYRSCDIFVLPTYMEGIPRVILEAQSAGLPIITTPVGGIPGAVQDGEDAILVPPGDPSEIADAIQQLIESKALRQHLIKNGLVTAKKNTLEKETHKMLSIVMETFQYPKRK